MEWSKPSRRSWPRGSRAGVLPFQVLHPLLKVVDPALDEGEASSDAG
jgi:hypothetical protein